MFKKLSVIIATIAITVPLIFATGCTVYDKSNVYKCCEDGTKNDTTVSVYRFKNIGFYSPDEEIPLRVQVNGTAFNGKSFMLRLKDINNATLLKASLSVPAEGDSHTIDYTINPINANGAYSVMLAFPVSKNGADLSFYIGVVNSAKRASKDFYYGVQTYFTRVFTWGNFNKSGLSNGDFAEAMLDTIDYMGVNAIREDLPWSTIQPTEDSDFDFELTDAITKAANDRGITYNWIVNACTDWGASEKSLELMKTTGQELWQCAPKIEYWKNYCAAIGEHYADSDILWEIWNEPDWEFLVGDSEDYLEMLRVAGTEIKAKDKDAYVYAGGLAIQCGGTNYTKDRPTMYRGYAELLKENIIDNYAYHIHGAFTQKDFLQQIENFYTELDAAGLDNTGIFNTECGYYASTPKEQAKTDISKALWSRGHDNGMFVIYSFTQLGEGEAWSIFNDYLSPKPTAVAYTELISLLGQSKKTAVISDDAALYAEMYYDGTQTVIPVYSTDAIQNKKLTVAEDIDYTVIDMYGNKIEKPVLSGGADAPYYIIIRGSVDASKITVTDK